MNFLFAVTMAVVFSTNAYSAVALFQENDGKIEILAKGNPSALKIKGQGSGPSGTVDLSTMTGDFEFDLTSLDTGIKLRNEHMKEKYLQTNSFPKAKLKILSIDTQGANLTNDFDIENAKFNGVLSLHGVEKPISGGVNISRKGVRAKVSANFKVSIADYGIETPSFAGITVTQEVDISVNAEATVQ